jgi:hypothetical protein
MDPNLIVENGFILTSAVILIDASFVIGTRIEMAVD